MELEELHQELNDNSTKDYNIEYNTYLSNHFAHGAIALYRVGASKSRVQQFEKWYCKRLESPSDHVDEVTNPLSNTGTKENKDFDLLLGRRIAFFPLKQYYENLLNTKYNNDVTSFISALVPKMIDGVLGAATHPMIHMGYGYSVGSSILVVEGMAYSHHSYLPFKFQNKNGLESSFGSGETDILEVLEMVRKDDELFDFMVQKSEDPAFLSSLGWKKKTGRFVYRAAALSYLKADTIAAYVSQISLPDWFRKLKGSDVTISSVVKLMDWVIECAVITYCASERRNDFFLLHGVTSAWSLQQLISAFKDSQAPSAVKCIQSFLCAFIALYLIQNRPKINLSYLSNDTRSIGMSWNDVISSVCEKEDDEHNYKLLQVCYEKAKSLKDDDEKQKFYKTSAMLPLKFPFVFE